MTTYAHTRAAWASHVLRCEILTRVVESWPVINNPDDGHTFTIAVSLRGSGRVVGDPHDTDSTHFDDMVAVSVRAWNLRDALLKAAELPLRDFFPTEDDEES